MWACLDWDLTGYKIIIIFWRKCEQEWWSGTRDSEFLDWEMWASLLIRYKRLWSFSKEMWVWSLLISLQDHDSFWRNVTKIEQVTCNKFMVFWRNLSKTWSGVARSSSKQCEQDWCCKQDHRFLTTLRARLILLPMWVEIFFSGVWYLLNFDHTY